MEICFSFGTDELRIIGHSINWQLNGPYEYTSPPHLSEQDADILRLLFNDFCSLNQLCFSGCESVQVAVGEPYSIASGRMQLPPTYLCLMTDAVASFFREVGPDMTEISVITGLPGFKTAELLSRLQGADQSAPGEPSRPLCQPTKGCQ